MRRWLTAVAIGGAAALALTGCGAPAGVDGNLTDDWPAISEPKVFVPAAGVCHPADEQTALVSVYNPVDCARPHLFETVHVGVFTGEHAQRLTPPPAGSPAARAAFAECDRKTTEYVGGEWRDGRLGLAIRYAPGRAWAAGGRWFRCDVTEMVALDSWHETTRTASLAAALTATSPLRFGCFNPRIVKKKVEGMEPVGCRTPHRSEYVGVHTAPDTTYDSFNSNRERTHEGCRDVLAAYAKVPNDERIRFRAGTFFYVPSREAWADGDRGVHCFAYLSDRTLTRSIKGVGDKGLPVR
ncbi:Septum formation [Micromonospora pattaloongensis]|uniref:Septum formation n=1 Tax=Micromonospora pattaloongensis TaxID=405436 RepID=A0A1H3S294_9ACTN|nr:septum formation family protein [Micromonospora pattaloongensis]SDZ32173.1 Septum formation [Micromonospora pattaloongensis]